jgi:hypothetical protein
VRGLEGKWPTEISGWVKLRARRTALVESKSKVKPRFVNILKKAGFI